MNFSQFLKKLDAVVDQQIAAAPPPPAGPRYTVYEYGTDRVIRSGLRYKEAVAMTARYPGTGYRQD